MKHQIRRLNERFTTHRAHIRFLAGVRPHMRRQCRLMRKPTIAYRTGVWFIGAVHFCMGVKQSQVNESFAAHQTDVGPFAGMRSPVNAQRMGIVVSGDNESELIMQIVLWLAIMFILFVAHRTYVFPFTYVVRVFAKMPGQRTALGETLVAHSAFVRFIFEVNANVSFELDDCWGGTQFKVCLQYNIAKKSASIYMNIVCCIQRIRFSHPLGATIDE